MKLCLKFLISLVVGSFVYTAVSMTFGSCGSYALSQLESQRSRIAVCTNEIENINNELNLEKAGLLFDDDVIAAYARRLGYISDGDVIVKINGLPPYQQKLWDTGNVTIHTPPKFVSEEVCKVLGLVFFALTFIAVSLFGALKNNGEKKEVQKEATNGAKARRL